jgi:hypothetical protein
LIELYRAQGYNDGKQRTKHEENNSLVYLVRTNTNNLLK